MSELLPEDRALFEDARGAFDPSAADRARVRAALGRRLGAGAGLTATAISAKAAAAGGSLTTAGKILVAIALAGGGVTAVHAVASSQRPQPVETRASAPRGPAAAPPRAPEAPEIPAPSPPPAAPAAVTPRMATADALAIETSLILGAKSAMRSNDAARALSLLDEHQRRFPRGTLAQERSAERIVALCGLGRSREAHDEASRFLANWPHSPLAEGARASCGDDFVMGGPSSDH